MRISWSLALLASSSLAACGAAYVSPSIGPSAAGANVRVIPLTVATVAQANSTPYTPKSLPDAFFPKPHSPDSKALALDVPEHPVSLPPVPSLAYRPPPDVEEMPYQLGIGDVVQIIATNDDTTAAGLAGLLASQQNQPRFSIRDDGSITLPDVGKVLLAGLTLQDAENVLFDRFVEQQLDPAFRLEIAEFQAAKLAIGGAVKSAKILPVGMQAPTISEALSDAGGFAIRDQRFATIRIYRSGTLYQIPVQAYLADPDLQQRRLAPGDAVFVDTIYDLDQAHAFYTQQLQATAVQSDVRKDAQLVLESEMKQRQAQLHDAREAFVLRQQLDPDQRDFVILTGEVDNRGRKPLPYGKQANLVDILYGSGGFSPATGDPSQVYVLRKSGDHIVAWHLDASNIAALVVAQDMQMRPGDIIFVEEQKITKFGRALDQALPSLINATGRIVTQ